MTMTLKNICMPWSLLTSLYASTLNTPHIGEQQNESSYANHNEIPQSQ